VNGNYAMGGYSLYQYKTNYLQNYYFGLRRYPYTTDMSRNPLTFRDIDPAQADYCSSDAPFNPGYFDLCNARDANEVHNIGEVWCVMLWEARANLINKYGWATGNQLILQLVTDAMNLTPPRPNFIQARNAILQADLVDTGGANTNELWAAFAKRGLGAAATAPTSTTVTGVHEAFDLPGLPPVITVQPISRFAQVGTNLRFSVTATGTMSFTYQWLKDDVPIANGPGIGNATNSTLTISNVFEGDAGRYSVSITNEFGSALSSYATLTVFLLDHFTWAPVPSPQSVGVPTVVTIEARSASNSIVTNFNGTVALSAATGGLTTNTILPSPVHSSIASGNWTLGYAFTPNTNLTVTDVRHYFGTKVSIWTDAGVLLAAQEVTSARTSWVTTPLPHPCN
jgi:hypothetical protein